MLRKESEVLEFERKIREIENGLRQEAEKMRATAAELSNLHKASFCGSECVAAGSY